MKALRYAVRLVRLLLVVGLGVLLAGMVTALALLGFGRQPVLRQRLTRWFHVRQIGRAHV